MHMPNYNKIIFNDKCYALYYIMVKYVSADNYNKDESYVLVIFTNVELNLILSTYQTKMNK